MSLGGNEPRQTAVPPHWLWFMLPMVISAFVRDFWAPDEPRYAEVAREIFDGGNFLVMHVCGAVYPDKPPLLFWLAGFGGWLSGWSEFVMRIPSLAATALTAWMVAVLARRWWGEREETRWAPVLFLGFAMVVNIGGRLQIDPLLTALCVGALAIGTVPADDRRTRTRNLLIAGLLVGFGGLAKGPLAHLNVGLVALAWKLFVPAEEKRVDVGRWVWPTVVFLSVLPVLTWALAAVAARPELARELFFNQHVGRVTKADRHPGPPWDHLVQMPLMLLPWTLFVGAGLISAWRQWKVRKTGDLDVGVFRAGLWILVLFVFYSAIPPKRNLYLLPAYPAAALLAARALAVRIREGRLERWIGRATVGFIVLLGAVFLVAGLLDDRVPGLAWRGPVIGVPVLLVAFLAGGALHRGQAGRFARCIAVAWLVLGIGVGVWLYPAMDGVKSIRNFAQTLATRLEKPDEIPCVGQFRPAALRFYGGVPSVPAESFEPWLDREGESFLGVANKHAWDALPDEEKRRFKIVEERRVGGKTLLIVVAADPSSS